MASGTVRQNNSVVLSHPVGGHLLWQLQEVATVLLSLHTSSLMYFKIKQHLPHARDYVDEALTYLHHLILGLAYMVDTITSPFCPGLGEVERVE